MDHVDIRKVRVVITGRTQTGKTSFIRCALIPMLGAYIIYDPDIQFTGYGVIVDTVPALRKAIMKEGHRRIVFQPRDILMGLAEQRVEEFDLICRTIDKLSNVTFIVDEISHITRPEFRRSAFIPPVFSMLIKRRMKEPHNIGIIITTQRMKDADVDFISQAQLTYTFSQNALDAKYVAEKIGLNIKGLIETLPPYHYIKYNHITRNVSKGTFEWVPLPEPNQHS